MIRMSRVFQTEDLFRAFREITIERESLGIGSGDVEYAAVIADPSVLLVAIAEKLGYAAPSDPIISELANVAYGGVSYEVIPVPGSSHIVFVLVAYP